MPSAPRRTALSWIIFALLVAFLAAVFNSAHADVSVNEARTLWIVRDVVQVEPAALRDVASAVISNGREALARTQFPESIYVLLLEGWTRLFGETIFAVRLLTAFLGIIVLAVIFRLVYKVLGIPRTTLKAVGFGILALLLVRVLTPTISWLPTITDLQGVRAPTEPAIIDFAPFSPAAYYDLRYGLKRGLALDLAWRDPDPAIMQEYVEQLTRTQVPVWVMMPRSAAQAWNVFSALDTARYAPTKCLMVEDVLLIRMEHDPLESCDLPADMKNL